MIDLLLTDSFFLTGELWNETHGFSYTQQLLLAG